MAPCRAPALASNPRGGRRPQRRRQDSTSCVICRAQGSHKRSHMEHRRRTKQTEHSACRWRCPVERQSCGRLQLHFKDPPIVCQVKEHCTEPGSSLRDGRRDRGACGEWRALLSNHWHKTWTMGTPTAPGLSSSVLLRPHCLRRGTSLGAVLLRDRGSGDGAWHSSV